MRLLTHNHLSCIRKGCTKRYPLALHAEQVEQTESNCNPSFVAHTMIHIDYPVLYNTAKELGLASGLPLPDKQLPDWVALAAKKMREAEEEEDEDDDADDSSPATGKVATSAAETKAAEAESAMESTSERGGDEELLDILHTLLLDTHVMEGELECGGCRRRYVIQQGIPNMRLNEDEV